MCVNTAYAVSSGSNPLAKLHIQKGMCVYKYLSVEFIFPTLPTLTATTLVLLITTIEKKKLIIIMAELLSEINIDDKLEDNYSYYCLISHNTSLIFVPPSAYTANAR